MSEQQYRDRIAALLRQQATEDATLAKAREAAAKARSDAQRSLERIKPNTSESSARTYRRSAESSERKAQSEDAKATRASKKLGDVGKDLAAAHANLNRELQSEARRAEAKRKSDERARDSQDARRRQTEKTHAREVARLMQPEARVVHEIRELQPPRPEKPRVLYITANPHLDLRTDGEVRGVQQAVRGALHRDLIEIAWRPAAQPEDLLDGLNDVRPHVVHFAGHAGGAALAFESGGRLDDDSDGGGPDPEYALDYDSLARALGATGQPPTLVALNGCDTMDGADVVLSSVGAVVATATSVGDLAASTFAAKFYAAVAAGQPIAVAVDQGRLGVEFMGLDEGWKHDSVARPDVDLTKTVLIQPPGSLNGRPSSAAR